MTAKLEELWQPVEMGQGAFQVTAEDIRHMQSRVHQLTTHYKIPDDQKKDVPNCKYCFCGLVVRDSVEFAHRAVPVSVSERLAIGGAPSGDNDGPIDGFDELMDGARASSCGSAGTHSCRDRTSWPRSR